MQPDEVVDAVERLGVLLDHRVGDPGLDQRVDRLVRRGGIAADRRAGVPADPVQGQPGDVVEETPTTRGQWGLGEPSPAPSRPSRRWLAPAGILLGELVRGMGERDVGPARETLTDDAQGAAGDRR